MERVRAWKASGKTRAAMARGKPYSERSLGWWSWKLASEGERLDGTPKSGTKPKPKRRGRKQKPLEVVELVELRSEPRDGVTIRMGVVDVLVGRGFDRELLGDVLSILEARR